MNTGPLGFPRLTSLGPLSGSRFNSSDDIVSQYNYQASQCDTEFCFNGMSKKEALLDILEVYKYVSDVAPERYSEIGVDIDRVSIVGSVATGNFGCRSMEKQRKLIEEEYKLFFDRRIASIAEDITQQASSIQDMGKILDERLGQNPDLEEEELLLMMKDNLCSDVDMFMPADLTFEALQELQQQREFQHIQDSIGKEANKMTELNMLFEPGVRSIDEFERVKGPEISSPSQLEHIIDNFRG